MEMFRPYGRIVLLHVCIIFGGIVIMFLGSPMMLVVLLMVGKTVVDMAVHVASHPGQPDLDPVRNSEVTGEYVEIPGNCLGGGHGTGPVD